MATPLQGFHHIAIIASDYARSKSFNIDILGAQILTETYRAELQSYKLDLRFADGSQLELFSFPNPPPRASYPEACGLRHLAFKTTDIGQAVAYFTTRGIVCEPLQVDELTGMQYTFLRDPDELPIELYQVD